MAIFFSCQCFSMFCKYFQHIFLEVPSQSFNQFRYLSHILCLVKQSEAKRSEAKRSEAERGGAKWGEAKRCGGGHCHATTPTATYTTPPTATTTTTPPNKRPCESRLRTYLVPLQTLILKRISARASRDYEGRISARASRDYEHI